MSSHVGAAGVCGPSRVGDRGTEDTSGESSNSEVEYTADALCLEVSPWLRSTDPGEGRSTVVKQLVRPPLPGRKAHRKSRSVDNGERDRGNLRERNQDRGEERESVESVRVKENVRERQSQRKTERPERHGERLWDREGRSGTAKLSGSNSDFHQSSAVEVVEGSNNLQTGLPCPRPHCIGHSLTSTASTHPQFPQPAMSSMSPALPRPPIRTRSTPLSPQRLSPRRAAGELRRCPPHSSRQPDPFWAEVRTEAGIGWSSESHRIRTHIPSPASSELGEEEEEEGGEEEEEEGGVEGEEEEEEEVEEGEAGGSGVMEVMIRTMTPAVALSSTPFAEGRMRKRERNRIKCLRRRQRRKERWRQSQLQENRQVNNTKELLAFNMTMAAENTLICKLC